MSSGSRRPGLTRLSDPLAHARRLGELFAGDLDGHEVLTDAEAAVREVLEESGVTAVAGERIGDLEYNTARGRIRARFFAMAFQSEGEPGESRERAWVTAGEARKRLRWDDARQLLERAERSSRRG